MSSATEIWLSAEKISVPAGRPTETPEAWPLRFFGAPQPSAGYRVGGWVGAADVGVDIFGTPIGLWDKAVSQRLPGHRKSVDAVSEAVVLERHLVDRNGEFQCRYAAQQGVEHDLQLGP